MAVTLEGGFPVKAANGVANTSLTQSITVGSGANRLLVVLTSNELVAEGPTSITFGGVGLTKWDETQSTAFAEAHIWYLIAPVTSTANVVMSWTGNSGGHGLAAYVFDGVDQATPLGTAGKGSAGSGTTTSHAGAGFDAGDYAVDILSLDSTGHSPVTTGSNVADYVATSDGGNEFRGSHNTTNATMSWSWSLSSDNAHITAVVQQAAGAAPDVPGDPVFYNVVSGPEALFGPSQLYPFEFRLPDVGVGAQTFPQALSATAVVVTASMLRQVNKLMSSTAVAVTASMARLIGKAMTSTSVAVTGSVLKQVSKALISTAVAVTATLATVKVKLLAMTATTVVVTASMVKQVNKLLTATAVAVTASLRKQVNKLMTATTVVVTATLTTIKVKLLTLSATAVVVTASMARSVGKPLSATVTLSASLVKQASKRLTATTVAVTATLATVKVKLVTMAANAVVVTASMVRQTRTTLSATVALSSSMVKRVAKTLSATSVVTGTMQAVFGVIATFLARQFDAVSGRGRTEAHPGQPDSTSSPRGRMSSNPDQDGFD